MSSGLDNELQNIVVSIEAARIEIAEPLRL